MPDRVVSYVFRGNFTSLAGGLTAAGRGVQDLGTKLTALDRNGVKMRAGLDQVGRTAGRVGLLAAAGLGAAVFAAANFDQAMSNVQAATHETAANMDELRQAAIEAGQATKFSATEAAGAIEELAKAGVSTTDILDGGLSGALDLAAAGGLEVADAAQIAATALTQFKLAGADVPHVADLLAAGAGKAQGDVSDLSMALKQSGLVASQMGISIEETTGTLAAFASAGLLGSDAGTSFRTMLMALTPNTTKAANEMEALGLHFYDAQGQFVGLTAVAGQLQAAFSGLTQEQRDSTFQTLFGQDAVRAANVLYSQGAAGIEDWTNKVNDQGYAAETAAIKMDNLKGDLEQLRGAFETALIGGGNGSQGALRGLTQGLTDVVNAFNKMPSAGQNAAAGMLAVTAVLGGGLWFTSKTVQGISNTKKALDDLGWSSNRTAGSMARLARTAGGITAVAGAVTVLGNALADATGAKINGSDLQRDLESVANGDNAELLKRLADDMAILGHVSNQAAEPIHEALTAFGLFGNTAMDNASDNINQVDEALAGMVESGNAEQAAAAFDQIAAAITGAIPGSSFSPDFLDGFDSYATALDNAAHLADDTASATDKATGATDSYGVAARQSAQASQAEADALRSATDAMRKKTSATLAAFDAETGYRQALKDAKAQADKNNAGIKGNTDAALANRSALSQLAAAWDNQSAAVKNNEGRYRQARKDFLDTAAAMGVPTEAAKRLADQLLEIPKSRVTKVSIEGAETAYAKVQNLKAVIDSLHSKQIAIDVATRGGGFSSGGYTGDGGANEPAGVVHRGEVVIPQSLVRRDWSMLSARYGHLPGFAGGGMVGSGHGVGVATSVAADAVAQSLQALASMGLKELHQQEHIFDRRERLAEKELEAAQKRVDEERAALKDLRDARRQFMQDVTGNFRTDVFGGVDLSTAFSQGWLDSTFGNQLYAFAQQEMQRQRDEAVANGQTAPEFGGYNANDWLQQFIATLTPDQLATYQAQASTGSLNQDSSNASAFEAVLEQLRSMGLTGGAFTDLASSGNLALAQQYLAMGPQFVQELVADFRDRNQALRNLGVSVGNAQFGADIREQLKETRQATRIAQESRDYLREVKDAQKDIAARLDRIEKHSPKETGAAVGAAINNAVGHGQRRG